MVGLMLSSRWMSRKVPSSTIAAADELSREHQGTAAKVSEVTTRRINVPMKDFLAFPKVVDHLVSKGVHDPLSANESVLEDWLPTRLAIDIDEDALRGELGESATGGYVAFNV